MAGRSETGQVFANPDGTSTMTTYIAPQWVRGTNGAWADVNTNLSVGGDGAVKPIASPVDVQFSSGGKGPLVTLRQHGSTFTMTWPGGDLPKPTVDGSTATYAEVLAGVDLTVTANSTGFQHVLVVKNAAAAANPKLRKIHFAIGGDAKARTLPDGRVRFADGAGSTIALTSAASVWDSSIDQAAAGEVLPGVSQATLAAARANPSADLVSTAARPGVASKSVALGVSAATDTDFVLTPDAAQLADPKTVFPLYIDPAIGPGASKWAYANNINSNWDVGGQAWVGPNTYDGTLYRSFFDFPSTSGSLTWKGNNKNIISGSMNIWVDHTWSCGDTYTHMYRPNGNITSASGARMAWSTRPLGSSAIWLSSAASHANEAGGCGSVQPDQLVSFTGTTLKNDLQAAADASYSTYTVGLCACNSTNQYESTQDRWKKFFTATTTGGHAVPALSVTFDTDPSVPANLAPVHGVACGGTIGTTSPTLEAQYADVDTADTLTATFEWKQLPSGTATQVAGPSKPANNVGSVPLTLGSAAEGKSYSFRVQTKDNSNYLSPWSGWCDFTVNASAPTAPVVTSTSYPSCVPANVDTCAHPGGPGVTGQFVFSEPAGDPNGSDVTSYLYGWTTPPTTVVTVAAGQASPTMNLTPPHYGLNTLYVLSKDPAGAPSPITSYTFLVDSPSAALAYWPLDDIRGHGFTDQVSSTALTTTNVTWTANGRYQGATAATFGASGDAKTTGAKIDTTKSFSVSVWVRLTDATNNYRAVISQEGVNTSGFAIYNMPDTSQWTFALYDTDTTTTGGSYAHAPAKLNVWTNITAVYDASEKTMKIYTNGVLGETVTRAATPWASSGKLHLGWAKYGAGLSMTTGVGQIADVRLWNRAVTVDDINGTDADPANGIPAQTGLLSPMQVGSWDFSGGVDCYCPSVIDGAYFGRQLNLDAGWINTPPSSSFALNGHDGNDALSVDGVTGFASTTDDQAVKHPVVRTDQSLTFSAWVNVNALTGADQVILRQGTTASSAAKLFVSGTSGKFVFAMATPDGSGGYIWANATSAAVAVPGTWTHLTGVFDAVTGKTKLYVDGVAQTSEGSNAVGWDSTDSLLVGTTGTTANFGGLIDQVKVYQGVLNSREAAALPAA
ncbi:hypothetical protein Cs7R123_28140 [Catellatospora sp. TT07R-123]|nr:hypothetical protein Cs7R123_28140 [Catellatospora sp. TT07R-123]